MRTMQRVSTAAEPGRRAAEQKETPEQANLAQVLEETVGAAQIAQTETTRTLGQA